MNGSFTSEYISDFLDFLDASVSTIEMAESDLEDANLELQDLEHYVELGKYDAIQGAKILKSIRNTRQRRRTAKNNIELCQPIAQWAAKNKDAISSLQQLLGTVRKTEELQIKRGYAIRTHILDDVTNKTHL